MLHGVPRWMVREAERIARTDPDAAAAIVDFDVFGQAQWDPSEPGVVILRYPNGCGCCGDAGAVAAAAGPIAEDPCVPDLLVVVNVDTARVLAVRPG